MVVARGHVGEALDLGLGHDLAEEAELARAGLPVPEGDFQDGAVVLDDPPGAVVRPLDAGQIAVLVEDAGQLVDPGIERLPGEAFPRPLDPSLAAPIEQPVDHGGLLGLHAVEQLVGQLPVGLREQVLGGRGRDVEELRASGAPATLDDGDQALAGQRAQVLAEALGVMSSASARSSARASPRVLMAIRIARRVEDRDVALCTASVYSLAGKNKVLLVKLGVAT
jgi:hypothetical protein